MDVLGCEPGRAREGWLDVWFYGLQLTLQERPAEVRAPEEQGVRHFGVTLGAPELEALLARLAGRVEWVSPVSTDHAGTPREQTKAKLCDPSGNVIEVKAYRDPTAAWERTSVR